MSAAVMTIPRRTWNGARVLVAALAIAVAVLVSLLIITNNDSGASSSPTREPVVRSFTRTTLPTSRVAPVTPVEQQAGGVGCGRPRLRFSHAAPRARGRAGCARRVRGVGGRRRGTARRDLRRGRGRQDSPREGALRSAAIGGTESSGANATPCRHRVRSGRCSTSPVRPVEASPSSRTATTAITSSPSSSPRVRRTVRRRSPSSTTCSGPMPRPSTSSRSQDVGSTAPGAS